MSETNIEFKKGLIEDLKASAGIADNSVDCVISNCVINLTANKEQVFREIWRVLKPGGELFFSDMYADRRIPDYLKHDKILWGEGLSGSMYMEDFRRLLKRVGFNYYYITKKRPMIINNKEIKALVGDIQYYAMTIRAFKIPEIEDACEDYGQEATYLGNIPGHEEKWSFYQCLAFNKGEKVRICSNLGEILTKSRFAKFFEVSQRKQHLGLF